MSDKPICQHIYAGSTIQCGRPAIWDLEGLLVCGHHRHTEQAKDVANSTPPILNWRYAKRLRPRAADFHEDISRRLDAIEAQLAVLAAKPKSRWSK